MRGARCAAGSAANGLLPANSRVTGHAARILGAAGASRSAPLPRCRWGPRRAPGGPGGWGRPLPGPTSGGPSPGRGTPFVRDDCDAHRPYPQGPPLGTPWGVPRRRMGTEATCLPACAGPGSRRGPASSMPASWERRTSPVLRLPTRCRPGEETSSGYRTAADVRLGAGWGPSWCRHTRWSIGGGQEDPGANRDGHWRSPPTAAPSDVRG